MVVEILMVSEPYLEPTTKQTFKNSKILNFLTYRSIPIYKRCSKLAYETSTCLSVADDSKFLENLRIIK